MAHWADKAVEQVEKDYDDGIIDDQELTAQLRDINEELEEARRDAAEEAYNNY